MIYYVSGPVTLLEPNLAVIECGGVGYGCHVTGYTSAMLKLNQPAKLYITESIREDAYDLYGFESREEQRCFELLTTVSGVGPKAAMAILSAGGPQNFTLAVMTGDEKMLTAAQGVGKKIAQRIIMELKDKIGGGSVELDFSTGPAVSAVPTADNHVALAHAALQELGYSPAEVAHALKGAPAGATTEELVRFALRNMVMKGCYSTSRDAGHYDMADTTEWSMPYEH
jgi:Holliday junction DNA helicase RuvA